MAMIPHGGGNYKNYLEISERFRTQALAYYKAFKAAKAFIDSHAGDPDMTQEMRDRYYEYEMALNRVKELEDGESD